MGYSDDWTWFCDSLSLKDPKQLGALFPSGVVHIVATVVRTLESSGGLSKGLSRLNKLAYLLDKSIEDYEQWLNKKGLTSYQTHRGRIDYLSYYREIEHMRSIAERSAFPQLAKAKSSDLFSVLAAVATLRDALAAIENADINSAVSLTVQATSLANGLAEKPLEITAQSNAGTMVISCQQKGGKNRWAGTVALKAWLVEKVKSMHQSTPFAGRAEAARWIEPDLIEEAKKYNLKPSLFNPENARDYADRALKAAKFSPKISL